MLGLALEDEGIDLVLLPRVALAGDLRLAVALLGVLQVSGTEASVWCAEDKTERKAR